MAGWVIATRDFVSPKSGTFTKGRLIPADDVALEGVDKDAYRPANSNEVTTEQQRVDELVAKGKADR